MGLGTHQSSLMPWKLEREAGKKLANIDHGDTKKNDECVKRRHGHHLFFPTTVTLFI
jgi:hypothetical protein